MMSNMQNPFRLWKNYIGMRVDWTCKAWWTGFVDGVESPEELGMGMTYTLEPRLNEVYDQGANLGQWVGKRLAGAVALFARN